MFNILKFLETKYKILFLIVVLIIVIPLLLWLATIVHDGIIHFFGGKTKSEIIASQRTTINKLVDTKVNNEITLNIVKKKNDTDIKHIVKVNDKIKKVSKDMNKIKSHVDDDLNKYVKKTALMLKDKSILKVDTKQPIVKEVTTIKKQRIKKTNIVKNKKSQVYVVNKKEYEVEGYKNITSIWNAYENTKDVK